jgi:hypothetical protein
MALDALMKKQPFKLLDGVTAIEQGKILVLDGQSQSMVLNINGGIIQANGTLSLGANPTDGESFKIGFDTYTFVDALSKDPVTEDAREILLGTGVSALQDTVTAIVAALNGGAGRGIVYGEGTLPNIHLTADDDGGGDIDVNHKVRGVNGNNVVTTELMGAGAWGNITLVGGTDGVYSLEFRASQDGITWYLLRGRGMDDDVLVNNITSDVGMWQFDVKGVLAFKVDMFSYTSGRLNVTAMTDRLGFS